MELIKLGDYNPNYHSENWRIPTCPWTLMSEIYRHVLPAVHRYLGEWKERANQIPNPELRKQALMSIETKTFHCAGGAIYGLLAKNYRDETIRFIVAYQTISDYKESPDNSSVWEAVRHSFSF